MIKTTKAISCILALLILLSMIPFASVYAADVPEGLEYLVRDGYIEVTNYTGTATELVIPSEIESLPVKKISTLTSDVLTSIIIPSSVTSTDTFRLCENINTIYVDSQNEHYTSIDGILFDKSKSTILSYPPAKADTSYSVPSGVSRIGAWAFSEATSLKNITLPNSVTSIGSNAFYNTGYYNNIYNWDYYTDNVSAYYKVLYVGNALVSASNTFGEYKIKDNTTIIADSAFYQNNNMTKITIPSSVKYIGSEAFVDCSFTSITIPSGVTAINDSTFVSCNNLTNISIPNTVTCIGNSAFEECTALSSITIPNTVTSIESYAFSDCKNLDSIAIPSGVTVINDSTFKNCSALSSVSIPSSVTTIGASAFNNCDTLTGFTIPSSITTIGTSAFGNCDNLTSIIIPETVTNIEGNPFNGCKNFENVYVNATNSNYVSEDGILFSKDKKTIICYPAGKTDTKYSIPTTATTVGKYALSGCSNLEEIIIPDSITNIDNGAFSYNTFTNINIPDSVTSLGTSTFVNCSNLTDITLGNGIKSLPPNMFRGCQSIREITIPEGVEMIEAMAFYKCWMLNSVVIPETVTIITANAFEQCSLSDVYYGGSEKQWNKIKIDYPENLYGNDTINDKFANATIHFAKESEEISLSDCTVTLSDTSYTYDGRAKKPIVTVKYGSTTLVNGTDYTVAYSNNTNVGTATVTVTGTGDYIGSASKTFSIKAKSISSATITLEATSYVYDGTAKKPTVTVKDGSTTLVNGTDYNISYTNNTNVGTATVTITGKGNYTGTATATFTIGAKSISNADVNLSATSYTYDGTAKKPTVTVKVASATLVNGTDYAVSYSNNTNVGTATATVTGKGDYAGTISKNFTITAKSISTATVTLSATSYNYDGNAKKPNVTVKDGSKTLVNGTDYTVVYSNNINVGTATVTVTGKGNYTGSVGKNFSIIQDTSVFTWGRDNWNFNNSSPDYYPRTSYRKQINNTYLNELKKNLDPTEYQVIFTGTWYSNAWLDDTWGGSCYGMSSTALLAKEGYLPYSQYKSGATKLFDLSYPKVDSGVSSLVTYYQMLQVKDVIQQQYRTVPYNSHETNIKKIISLLDKNDTVLVGFQKNGWGGHSVLAYGYEYGSWTFNGVTYDGCIKICDPNSSISYDKECNIYFNSKTYNWAIPFYSYAPIKSTSGAVFNYIGANISEINQGGYLSGTSNNNIENYVARINAPVISESRTVSKVTHLNGIYMNQSTAPGEIVEDYSYILCGESEGTVGYNLYDSNASYKVSQENASELQLSIDYENCYLTGGSAAGNSIIFDKSGFVEVHGESADYNISMTFDDNYSTDWFAMQVVGSNADEASLKMVEGGYILTSDNLDEVSVFANNKEASATTSFTTEYTSVYIYQIDESTIGIKVDADSNGTYETVLETDDKTDYTLGDVNTDGNLNIKDATAIQKHIAGILTLSDEGLAVADYNKDNAVNVKDATAIQKFLAGII